MTKPLDIRRVMYSVRAKHQFEAVAHSVTRCAFLTDVVADERTRDLFERWGHWTGLDAVVADVSPILDVYAVAADLTHRSQLRGNQAALQHVADVDDQARLGRRLQRIDALVAETREPRAAEVMSFIGDVLYKKPPPFIAWLATDLLDIFQAELTAHLWGTVVQMQVPLSPTTRTVPKGRRPKHDGEHLTRNAHWYYRHVVQHVSEGTLAEDYRAAKKKAGVYLGSRRDLDRTKARADTKPVRAGILDAQRLLELTVPPKQWLRYFKIQA